MISETLKNLVGLTPTERSVRDLFLREGSSLADKSARAIASELYCAPSTVTRVCKRLGYEGYVDFRAAYLEELRYLTSAFTDIDANQPFKRSDDEATIAAKMSALYRETVTDTASLIDESSLKAACDLIEGASAIVFCSQGPQLQMAHDFADKMARIGYRVIVPEGIEVPYFLASAASGTDVFVALSYSGQTPSLMRVCTHIHEQRRPIIALTSLGRNPLSDIADVVLNVSTRERLVEKVGAFAMSLSTMYILDTLYSCLFARSFNDNAIRRAKATHDFELFRDSDNPILHDRRDR